mgnify:CR=1 FL=1
MINQTFSPTSTPNYFYRVTQLIQVKSEDALLQQTPFYRDFSGYDLLACRKLAYQYSLALMEDLAQATYFEPQDQPLILNIDAENSISLLISLIEYINEDDYTGYPLNSDNLHVRKESLEKEFQVLSPLSKRA